jgi:hypothetical protein
MTRSLYVIPATLCLAAAVVAAQAPAADKRPGNPPATQPVKKITYVGCVKPGTSTGTWVLENAEAQRAGATGSGAGRTSGESTMTLSLDPAATVNLKAHVNHKVEIAGMMSTGSGATATAGAKGGEAAAGVTGPTSATDESGTPGAARVTGGTAAADAPGSVHHFRVESLKMVSTICP